MQDNTDNPLLSSLKLSPLSYIPQLNSYSPAFLLSSPGIFRAMAPGKNAVFKPHFDGFNHGPWGREKVHQ
jgi:hypothetical protein